jgi:hypothetical protein
MSRLLALSLVVGLACLSNGCAMCCAPFDYDYQAVTSRWTRTSPSQGRVASAFAEAGVPEGVAATSATAPLETQSPTPAAPTPALPPVRSAPGGRSVIPRNMGETYLQNGP